MIVIKEVRRFVERDAESDQVGKDRLPPRVASEGMCLVTLVFRSWSLRTGRRKCERKKTKNEMMEANETNVVKVQVVREGKTNVGRGEVRNLSV